MYVIGLVLERCISADLNSKMVAALKEASFRYRRLLTSFVAEGKVCMSMYMCMCMSTCVLDVDVCVIEYLYIFGFDEYVYTTICVSLLYM